MIDVNAMIKRGKYNENVAFNKCIYNVFDVNTTIENIKYNENVALTLDVTSLTPSLDFSIHGTLGQMWEQ